MNYTDNAIEQKNISDIKAAFFDIDGTILKADNTISPVVVKAIKKLQDTGVKICLATGRPFFAAHQIIKELEIRDASMFFSGSLVIEPCSEKILLSEPIKQKELLLNLAKEINSNSIHLECYGMNEYFIEKPHALTTAHKTYLNKEPELKPFDERIFGNDIYKLVAISQNDYELSILKKIAHNYPEFSYGVGLGASHSSISFMNITSLDASRDNVFRWMLEYFAINAEQTMAFGDAEADIPFLKAAGIGVALGNASQTVKNAANYITTSVEEDGVLHVLQRMGLSGI